MPSDNPTVTGEWIPGPLGMGTELVHASVSPDNETGAILTPVFLSTTFVQESVDKYLAKASQQSAIPSLRLIVLL
ncbi:Cystathionine [Perkinsus olseni]|uniref:Cystathionine n=1 Tax=Perkinsus olseni TaxID=32597 RepID=A0A7J6Q876_PEROL|nr:Cystathionine [Perkinsus olseni]